jgi:hypothetical protein
MTRTHEVKTYELSSGHNTCLYISENKFLNSIGSSNDLHGRNLGHVMLSNLLPALIATQMSAQPITSSSHAICLCQVFPSLAMHVEIAIKEFMEKAGHQSPYGK